MKADEITNASRYNDNVNFAHYISNLTGAYISQLKKDKNNGTFSELYFVSNSEVPYNEMIDLLTDEFGKPSQAGNHYIWTVGRFKIGLRPYQKSTQHQELVLFRR